MILKTIARLTFKIAMWLFVLLVLLFLIYGGWWEWSMYKPLMTKKFKSDEWIAAHGDTLEKRCGMYHDLTRNYLKKGMSIKDVEGLLGVEEWWSYCKTKKIKCTMHHMGTCYSNALSIVPMVLYTCFSDKEKLVTYDREEHCEMQGMYNVQTKNSIAQEKMSRALAYQLMNVE